MRCAVRIGLLPAWRLMRAGARIQIAVFGAVWLTAAPTAAQSGGVEGLPVPLEEPKKSRGEFSFDVALWGHHDDNILELSDQNIAIFDSGDYSPDRFLINSVGDFITSLSGRARWAGKPWARHETRVAVAAEANWYADNPIKNYQTYALFLSQELTASRKHLSVLRLTVSHTPEYYLQQLTDDDASFNAGRRIRESVTYRQTYYRLAYDQTLIEDRFDARLAVQYQRRNYNQFFPERDDRRDTVGLTLGGRPFAHNRFSIEATAGLGRLLARGNLDWTPWVDDNISYDVSLLGLNASIPWRGKRGGRVELEADREIRTYTTTNKFDTSHFERVDHRLTWNAGIVQKLPAGLEFFANYESETNDTQFPRLVIAPNDTTSFVANRIAVGLRWRTSIGR
jgi:hypothetical protein